MSFQRLLPVFFVALALTLTGLPSASAEDTSEGMEILLTVSGRAKSTVQGEDASFSITSLRALPSETFKTSTVWTDGILEFTGTPLSAILEASGRTGTKLIAKSSNDYNVEISIPKPDARFPIVAYELNGKEMSLRDKGPLWLVFPYDHDDEYQKKTIYAESVWQLESLSFQE